MAQHPVYTAVIADKNCTVDDVNSTFYKQKSFDSRTQLMTVEKVIDAAAQGPNDIFLRLSNKVAEKQQVSGQIKGLAEVTLAPGTDAKTVVPKHLYNYSSTPGVVSVLLNNNGC